MIKYFDFEKKIENIDNEIEVLSKNNNDNNIDLINKYNKEKIDLFKKIYGSLSPWQKVQVARHPNRPHTLDYIDNIFSKFILLSGDKKFAEDKSIIGGIAK